jgi:hypothetical protein
VENARLMIPSLVQAQQLNEDQTQALRDIVAWRLMGNDVTASRRAGAMTPLCVRSPRRSWSDACGWRWATAIAVG